MEQGLRQSSGRTCSHKKGKQRQLPFFAKKEFDKKTLKILMKEFANNAESPLYGDYDRGYFSGLVRLAKIMEEEEVYSLTNNTRSRAEEAKPVAQ